MNALAALALAILAILLVACRLRTKRAELHDALQGLCEFHIPGDEQ